MLLSYARALLYGDEHEAEDVVQEAFLTAHQRLDAFRRDENFARWLRGIARNKAFESRRVVRRRREVMDSRILEGMDAVPPLSIETPAGMVRAAGTKFYVGSHFLPSETTESKGAVVMTSFTRVLVLAGAVALANAQGSVTGQANHLLAAQTGKAPTNYAVTANSDFAIDLYRQLSKGNSDQNLFFSPYSVSSALAMAAEGARGETALEMGQVLRFPAAARRIGDDAQLIPWNTSLCTRAWAS